MAKSVLNRSLFLSPSHTHAHIHTHTNIHQHKHLSPLPHRFTGPNTYTHALTRRYTCMNMHYQDTSTHSHVGFCMIHSNTYAHALIGRNTCMSMHHQDTFTQPHVDFCMEQCFEIDFLFFHASRFPDISSIKLKMPNIHFLPVNLKNKDNQTIVKVRPFFTSDVWQKLWQIFEVYISIDVAHH